MVLLYRSATSVLDRVTDAVNGRERESELDRVRNVAQATGIPVAATRRSCFAASPKAPVRREFARWRGGGRGWFFAGRVQRVLRRCPDKPDGRCEVGRAFDEVIVEAVAFFLSFLYYVSYRLVHIELSITQVLRQFLGVGNGTAGLREARAQIRNECRSS